MFAFDQRNVVFVNSSGYIGKYSLIRYLLLSFPTLVVVFPVGSIKVVKFEDFG